MNQRWRNSILGFHGSDRLWSSIICVLTILCIGGAAYAQTNPVPLINAPLVPSSAVPGGTGFTLTVNGTGFVSSSVVNWNGSARSTHFVSQSQLAIQLFASDIATATTSSVTVTNPVPGGGTSNVAYFSVTIPKSSVPFSTTITKVGDGEGGAVVLGDFNGDGKIDLVILSEVNASLAVLLGNGDGSFQPPTHIRLPRTPAIVTAADFNHDGKLDLAMSEINQSGLVEIMLGNGDGTFQAAQTFSTNQGQGAGIVAADLNHDGNPDLVIANQNKKSISVLFGNGDGTFQAAVDTIVGRSPVYLAVGDFNGDGNLDLAVTIAGESSVSILMGNGDGTFTMGTALPTNEGPHEIAIGDFNHDGILDLAITTASVSAGSVQVFLGNGDGTFRSGTTYGAGSYDYLQIETVDLNGDGNLDLIYAVACCKISGEGGVATQLGNGDGSFQSPNYYPVQDGISYLGAADVNGDGSMDIVAPFESRNGGLAVILQTPAIFLPSSLSFGTAAVGSSQIPQTTALTNAGWGPLQITGVSISGANAGDFSQTNNCPSSLAQGASCAINVTFAPTADGVRNATINVADAGAPRLQGVTLKGSGTFSGVSPTSLSFGNEAVGTSSSPQTVTLTNLGSTTLQSIKIKITGVNQSDFSGSGTCGNTLAAGASCSINVVFTPHATGSRVGTLNVTLTGTSNPAPVPLSGTGD